MVNGLLIGPRGVLALGFGILAFACLAIPLWLWRDGGYAAGADQRGPALIDIAPVAPARAMPARPAVPAVVEPPAVDVVLRSGVLIVVSKATQQMHVFKDGVLWRTTPVSTGRRGHATPAGVFPILQKKAFHRSNIYSGAPMPWMQRLTWSGIAIHAGHLPGYPASHGCIRVPRQFARALFGLTRASATTVVIANEPLRNESHARSFALNLQVPPRAAPTIPEAAPEAAMAMAEPAPDALLAAAGHDQPPAIAIGPSQTIQLAAAATPGEADAHWLRLLGARPELGRFEKAVIPAVVNARRVYRLRATASGAHAYCASLKSSGIDCFNVS